MDSPVNAADLFDLHFLISLSRLAYLLRFVTLTVKRGANQGVYWGLYRPVTPLKRLAASIQRQSQVRD